MLLDPLQQTPTRTGQQDQSSLGQPARVSPASSNRHQSHIFPRLQCWNYPRRGLSGGYIPGEGVADDWRNCRGGKNNIPGSAMSPYVSQQKQTNIGRPTGMAGMPTQRSEHGAAGSIWGLSGDRQAQPALAPMNAQAQPWQQQQQQQPWRRQQQQQQQQQQQNYQQDYLSQQQGSISSNVFSSGTSQNVGNVMTGRSTTKRLAPPGGFSSFSLG